MEAIWEIAALEFWGVPLHSYLAAFLAILFGFVGKRVILFILNRLIKSRRTKAGRLDFVVIKAIGTPLGWLLPLAGFYVATILLPVGTHIIEVRQIIDGLLRSASLVITIWLLVRIMDGVFDWWEHRLDEDDKKMKGQMIPVLRSSSRLFLILIGFILVLQNLGYSVSSLLAGVGLGGAALALASKDMVANIFGSVVIFFDKPFTVGDWIDTGGVEGTVEEIGIRTTKVRTFANSLVTVPNAIFTNTSINNWSRMRKRRIKMNVGLTYSTHPDKMEKAVEAIREIIRKDEKIHNDFFLVNFDNFGPFSLDVFIYCFTVTTNWAEFLQVKQDFQLKIMRAVHELGLSFAFPTQSLHIESIPGEPQAMNDERPL